jgi:hypothetical protein
VVALVIEAGVVSAAAAAVVASSVGSAEETDVVCATGIIATADVVLGSAADVTA